MNAVHSYSDAQALVFPPQYTDPTNHHRSSYHQSMPASPWSPSTHALMSSSQPDPTRMYSLMHQPTATIHTLPYSATSPVFYNHHPHNNHHPRMQLSTPVPLNFQSPQIESSIGPHRGVLTRRQARAAQLRGTPQPSTAAGAGHQHQEGTESTSPSETQDVRALGFHFISLNIRLSLTTSAQVPPLTQPSPSRSQTPANGMPSGEPSEHTHTPISAHQDPLSVPPLPSLYAAPSVPSDYPFPLFPGPGFSPRAVSPAHSVASAITSLTEGTSIRSEFDRTPFKCPTEALHRLIGKPRKQRLFNHQRKEICLYHQDNPGIRQEDIANKWGVERSTVSKILKQKSKWLNVPDGEEPHTAKHRYVPFFPLQPLA